MGNRVREDEQNPPERLPGQSQIQKCKPFRENKTTKNHSACHFEREMLHDMDSVKEKMEWKKNPITDRYFQNETRILRQILKEVS